MGGRELLEPERALMGRGLGRPFPAGKLGLATRTGEVNVSADCVGGSAPNEKEFVGPTPNGFDLGTVEVVEVAAAAAGAVEAAAPGRLA